MALKKKTKRSAASTRKKTGKAAVKKIARKKAVKTRKTAKKNIKKAGTKTARKRSASGTIVKKKTARTTASSGRLPEKIAPVVEPGPPSGSIPPVEEPVRQEEAIGIVTHYYSHLSVAVVQLNKGTLRTGDTIHIKGHSTDFTQTVNSLEYEHQHVDQAAAGQAVGIKVIDHAREHDILYRVK
ncbi:MAG: EF-Tu/IF-2/RF-3 family GTPase [Nitrospirota bacterium]